MLLCTRLESVRDGVIPGEHKAPKVPWRHRVDFWFEAITAAGAVHVLPAH
ncbi:MAG TPA: hypothetical protein VI957_00695 [Candidatus Paceibacterota bacterium]